MEQNHIDNIRKPIYDNIPKYERLVDDGPSKFDELDRKSKLDLLNQVYTINLIYKII